MIKIIFVGGINNGKVVEWDTPIPEFKVPIPLEIRVGTIENGEPDTEQQYATYRPAFISVDKGVFIYTYNGGADPLVTVLNSKP